MPCPEDVFHHPFPVSSSCSYIPSFPSSSLFPDLGKSDVGVLLKAEHSVISYSHHFDWLSLCINHGPLTKYLLAVWKLAIREAFFRSVPVWFQPKGVMSSAWSYHLALESSCGNAGSLYCFGASQAPPPPRNFTGMYPTLALGCSFNNSHLFGAAIYTHAGYLYSNSFLKLYFD